jgi:hypothetical protein
MNFLPSRFGLKIPILRGQSCKLWGFLTTTSFWTSDTFNKLGVLESELKKGEYKIVATATDEYGLTGEDETEIVVR